MIGLRNEVVRFPTVNGNFIQNPKIIAIRIDFCSIDTQKKARKLWNSTIIIKNFFHDLKLIKMHETHLHCPFSNNNNVNINSPTRFGSREREKTSFLMVSSTSSSAFLTLTTLNSFLFCKHWRASSKNKNEIILTWKFSRFTSTRIDRQNKTETSFLFVVTRFSISSQWKMVRRFEVFCRFSHVLHDFVYKNKRKLIKSCMCKCLPSTCN